MKYLTLVIVLVLSACANTPTSNQPKVENGYYRVLGTGKNFEEARLNGFQLAVEMAVGSIVVTEKQATNNILVRDQIVKHSSGYVDDFKIIEQGGSNLRYTIVMDVKVKSSQIANIILGVSTKDGKIDSNRIYGQYDSINQERKEAEKLIDNLLDSFPNKSFKYDVKPVQVKLNQNRDMVVNIVVFVSWNEMWLDNFIENFNRVNDGNKTSNKTIDVVKSPNSLGVLNNKTTLYINDDKIYYKARDTVFKPIYPVVELVDKHGAWIIRGCGNYARYDALGDVKPFKVEANYIVPKNSDTFENLKHMDRVNVYMTTNYEKTCL